MSHDLVVIIALSVGACLLTGLAGWGVLHLLRSAPLRYQLITVTLLPVVAVALAVAANVKEMFLSAHDSGVVLVGLAVAVGLAVLGAWLVTRSIMAGFSLLGRSIDTLTHSVDLPPPSESADQAATTDGRPAVSGGSYRPAELTGRALPAELATALANIATASQTLTVARTREHAAEQSRRELVSFMSHDLRTPLAGLRALIEGMEDGIVADVPRALDHLRATVARMSLLVDDLFALSRVQGPPSKEQRHTVSLAEVVDDVVFEATATADAAGVDLQADVAGDDRLAVLGNHADLTRAMSNLVTNAIRHTAPGLAVQVKAGRSPAGAVRVEVVDQCGGIPEPHLARVFDTGWRGSPARSGDDGGAGLGLAIVRGVVQSHEGHIGVRNTIDGCSFAVELPPPGPPASITTEEQGAL